MLDNLNIFILNYQYNHSEEYQIKGFFIRKNIKKNEQKNKEVNKRRSKTLKIFIDGSPLKKIKIKFLFDLLKELN